MFKKASIGAVTIVAGLAMAQSANAEFVIGGENGWQLTTDGIIDVFSTYASTSPMPGGSRSMSLLSVGGTEGSYDQRFGIGVGLLPSVIAFNVKAPTVNGIDSKVRIGIYPNIQNNTGATGSVGNRFETSPSVDFREVFFTAKGKYGELLAGRALNLFQGKNILNDMTLLTSGTIPGNAFRGGTTLGHIGYGYLYTNFGPQIRYTTPDFGGVKFALEVAEPYKISVDTAKTNSPRIEAELSYASKFGETSVQAWMSGLYQTAPRSTAVGVARAGKDNESIGGAYGVVVNFGGISLMGSGYGGKGLGMVSAQDGDFLGSTSTDANGKERLHWGYLVQATYQLTPTWKLGANYGQTRQEKNDNEVYNDKNPVVMKNQESAVFSVTYNLNKFIQFVGEYIYAQNTWQDGAKQHSNQFALGTMFYW